MLILLDVVILVFQEVDAGMLIICPKTGYLLIQQSDKITNLI